ncbi:50S ribosomal protein L9 [Buchnera aphidicola]|uniref:Large ribosomal subunit protein bL9 n=1 Tax=Buchnera aphidicola (Anoecia oenotherae) TaxID=1241833 RepID=A0A4D6Y143_9GAMM|nr:50S ribosomal protein L9 [Buchnera aphidicola]QCI19551.1 50S ribosomal protein L9 [Buchnera aphidicola (Anoecia oenotherae)]
MRLILLEKIKNIGNAGQVVEVKSGYARNFLIPKGKAIFASKENIKNHELHQRELEEKSFKKILNAKDKINQLQSVGKVIVYSQAGSKGKLFGSVGPSEVVTAIKSLGMEVNKKELIFNDGNLHYIGVHTIVFQPHKKVKTDFLVEIIPC